MEGNPTERKPEMTIELVKILEAAQYHYDKETKWFNAYEETEDETWLQLSNEQRMITQGLLEAYNILTGKKIYVYDIKAELEMC